MGGYKICMEHTKNPKEQVQSSLMECMTEQQ